MRSPFWSHFYNWHHSSITKNTILKVTGSFIWLLPSQRTHLGIWVDKNVSSAWCFSFQYGRFPWSPNLGENTSREQDEVEAALPQGQWFLPCSPNGAVWRERGPGRRWGLSTGTRRRFPATMASSYLASGSSPASLRLLYSVPHLILPGKWAISKGVKWL